MLEVASGEAVSGLERLRAGPRKLTATELMDALLRLRDVRAVGVGQITVDVPAGRERALARYGLVAKAQALRRMSAKRRDAPCSRRSGSSSSRLSGLAVGVRRQAVAARRLQPPVTGELGDQHDVVTAANEVRHPRVAQHMRRQRDPRAGARAADHAIDRPRRETATASRREQRLTCV